MLLSKRITPQSRLFKCCATLNRNLSRADLDNYKAVNEPIKDFKKGSPEREQINKTLLEFLTVKNANVDKRDALFEVPCVIGDKEVRTSHVKYQLVPFEHGIKLARFYHADKEVLAQAIENSLSVRSAWESAGVDFRANILLKAADTLAGVKRADILAATMLGQGKTVYQAGICTVCYCLTFRARARLCGKPRI